MKIIHERTNTILGSNIKRATSFQDRLLGLMFQDEMKGMDGLLIEPCRSIHNFFVRFPIDVVFISKKNTVVKVLRNFRPWQISGIYFTATKTLELPAGTLHEDIIPGDKLEVL
jgi:uncharacterized membrane protein (UPF0127 family)